MFQVSPRDSSLKRNVLLGLWLLSAAVAVNAANAALEECGEASLLQSLPTEPLSMKEDLASPNRTNWLDSIIARERNEEVMAVKGKNFRDDAMSIAGIGVAASTLNLADVVWMLPFLVGTAGVCSAAFFAIISQLWATLVVCLYIGGGLEEWSNNRYVDYMIGVIALAFALMQLMQENCHCVKDRDVTDDESNKHPAERFSLGAFALLTVVATFDQVLVYVPLLKREGVTCADLEVGILLATLVTFLICYIATKIPGVLNILKEIPIWLPALFVGVASICEGLLGF